MFFKTLGQLASTITAKKLDKNKNHATPLNPMFTEFKHKEYVAHKVAVH